MWREESVEGRSECGREESECGGKRVSVEGRE